MTQRKRLLSLIANSKNTGGLLRCCFLSISLILSGCGTVEPVLQTAPNPATERKLNKNDSAEPRQIELFFDGTANNWYARTNVRRRFEMVAWVENPSFPCCYIEGVGVDSLSGKIFGSGMKARVLKGYEFLARNWRNENDKIFIYGFSRGAFEARVLAGLMAHCGLPDGTRESVSSSRLGDTLDRVWKYCAESLKDPAGEPDKEEWLEALASNRASTSRHFAQSGFTFNNPRINFLALWDTVPGLPFMEFSEFGKRRNEKSDRPQLYKVRPYPNIQVIAHALSLDECRSRFSPLLVGPPIDSSATSVHEVWFPGSHADVGGGYEDSNDLAGKSFNWVFTILGKTPGLVTRQIDARFANSQPAYSDAAGIMHHPEKDFPNNLGSHEQRRIVPKNSMIDISVFKRAGQVTKDDLPYEKIGSKLMRIEYTPQIPVGSPGKADKVIHIVPSPSPEDILKGWLVLHKENEATLIEGKPLTIDKMTVPTRATIEPTPPKPVPPPAAQQIKTRVPGPEHS